MLFDYYFTGDTIEVAHVGIYLIFFEFVYTVDYVFLYDRDKTTRLTRIDIRFISFHPILSVFIETPRESSGPDVRLSFFFFFFLLLLIIIVFLKIISSSITVPARRLGESENRVAGSAVGDKLFLSTRFSVYMFVRRGRAELWRGNARIWRGSDQAAGKAARSRVARRGGGRGPIV